MTPARVAERVLEDVCEAANLSRDSARYGRGRATYARWAWWWLTWQILGEPSVRVIAEACAAKPKDVRLAMSNATYSHAWSIVKAVLR